MKRLYSLVLVCWFVWTCGVMASSHVLMRHYSIEDGLSQNTVGCIFQDSKGYMWFGTWDGLNRYDGYCFVPYRLVVSDQMAERSNRIVQIWEDEGEVYALNYDNQCLKVDGDHLELVSAHEQQRKSDDSIYVDAHGIVWTVDDQRGVSRYRDGEWKRFCPLLDRRYEGQLRRNFITIEDGEGNLWVNPTGGGFSKYNYEKDTLEWPFPQLTNMIHTAFIDRQGLLWLSTYDKGIDFVNLRSQPFECYDLRTAEDPVGEVRAMMVDDGELSLYQRDERQIYCVADTKYGRLYGTKGQGVLGLRMDLPCQDVYCLLEMGDTLFVGTFGDGIIQVVGDMYKVLAPEMKVRDMLWCDSILIAGTTSGLLVGTQLIPYNDVRCLMRDQKGDVWIGSFGGGLARLRQHKGGDFYIEAEPTTSHIVLAMSEDSNGKIWFTGECDVTCYHPDTRSSQRYNVFDGEQGSFFNEAKAVQIEGNIVFGYNHGYCRFDPAKIHQSAYVPSLVVNDIEYKNQTSCAISFAALDFTAPSKILYQWKLSGVDEDWVDATTERKASYTNLKPGKYIFTVRSSNSEGVWVDNEQHVTITIERTFWQTIWFYLIILLVVALIVWLIWRYMKTSQSLRQEVEVEQRVTDIKLRFFTNVSHELRTPLTLICGPVDNVLTNEKLSSNVREQLEIVSANAQRMLRMINMLLDFRKMTQHQLKLKIRPIHFWTLVEDTCNNFIKEAQKKSIHFERQLLSHDDLVWVDKDKMDTVLFNLLSNAFKYTPEGGTISVTLSGTEDFATLSVRDTGIGIPKEKRGVLFERFKSNNELSQNTSLVGTGIGLNLTKEIVDMHHSYIEVDSEEGKGSCFTVMIRKGSEHFGTEVDIVVDDAVTTSNQIVASSHKWSVQESLPTMLVVDDNADMRIFISNIFADQFRIQLAEDGLAAMDIIRQNVPSIIITDLMMPNMDGMELLIKLRANASTTSIPIIMLSAKTAIESQLEGLEHGADDYITKPFAPAFIKARVHNLLQQREKLKSDYRNQLISMDTHKQEKTPDDIFLARLMAYMDQQMDNNALTVDDMVDYMNLGRTVFFNRLKTITGLSPVEFIREVRIKRSVQLLEMNSYNITEITYMVGMSDSRYFSKCFKQVMGVTPSEYKRGKKVES